MKRTVFMALLLLGSPLQAGDECDYYICQENLGSIVVGAFTGLGVVVCMLRDTNRRINERHAEPAVPTIAPVPKRKRRKKGAVKKTPVFVHEGVEYPIVPGPQKPLLSNQKELNRKRKKKRRDLLKAQKRNTQKRLAGGFASDARLARAAEAKKLSAWEKEKLQERRALEKSGFLFRPAF